jgi:hypothetical protein
MFAAEQQLEAAQGVQDTPFVTMKLTINEQHEIIVEAFQVLRVVNYSPPCFSESSFVRWDSTNKSVSLLCEGTKL